MKIQEPSYYLKLNMQSCRRIVSVNGFELDKDMKGRNNNAEIPINHVIKNGGNYLELTTPPERIFTNKNNEDLICEVEIRVRGTLGEEQIDYLISNIVFTPDFSLPDKSGLHKQSLLGGSYNRTTTGELEASKNGKIILREVVWKDDYKGKGANILHRHFTADVDFPEWSFFTADEVLQRPMTEKKYLALEDILWPKVEELRDIFASKDIDKILPLFEMRSKEYDQAFYREPGQTLKELRNSIEDVFESQLPMDRVSKAQMQMYVSYDGRLVKIANAGTGNGTVIYYVEEADMYRSYDVYWMRKDGEWIIGR